DLTGVVLAGDVAGGSTTAGAHRGDFGHSTMIGGVDPPARRRLLECHHAIHGSDEYRAVRQRRRREMRERTDVDMRRCFPSGRLWDVQRAVWPLGPPARPAAAHR